VLGNSYEYSFKQIKLNELHMGLAAGDRPFRAISYTQLESADTKFYVLKAKGAVFPTNPLGGAY
ncbi:TPA: hypothetical protein ACGBJ3_004035, partial [Escherichia coli]